MSLKNVTFWYMFSKSVDFPLRAIMEGQKAYFSALSCLEIFSQNTLVSMRSDVKLLGWNSYVQSCNLWRDASIQKILTDLPKLGLALKNSKLTLIS